MESVTIGLASWIIQDGNYGDFHPGEATFAVEFYPLEIAIGPQTDSSSNISMQRVRDSRYRVTGSVLHVAKDWWVLDIGFHAYLDREPPPNAIPGVSVQGLIELSIDHFAYFERLGREPDAPPLIYDWQIQRIDIQTARWIEAGPRWRPSDAGLQRAGFERDASEFGWREVEQTNAWYDDDGFAEYLLHCRRTSAPPTNPR